MSPDESTRPLKTAPVVRARWPRLLARLLVFNLLLVFVPLAGALYLGTYEKQLLRLQERSMVQQGRLVAASLAGPEDPTAEDAERLLRNLQRRTESRLRVLDRDARLLADSSLLGPRREPGSEVSDEARGPRPPALPLRRRPGVDLPTPVRTARSGARRGGVLRLRSTVPGRRGERCARRSLRSRDASVDRRAALGDALFGDSDRARGGGHRRGAGLPVDLPDPLGALRGETESVQGRARLGGRRRRPQPRPGGDDRAPDRPAASAGGDPARSPRSPAGRLRRLRAPGRDRRSGARPPGAEPSDSAAT